MTLDRSPVRSRSPAPPPRPFTTRMTPSTALTIAMVISLRYSYDSCTERGMRAKKESMTEKSSFKLPGLLMLVVLLALLGALAAQLPGLNSNDGGPSAGRVWGVLATALLVILVIPGFMLVNPNQARVLQFLGRYSGTVDRSGFWWVNPFSAPRRRVSRRVRSLESSRLKVNDIDGNPIEIA